MGLAMASLYAQFMAPALKTTRQKLGCDYDILEIDEDFYPAVLQAAKLAQSAA